MKLFLTSHYLKEKHFDYFRKLLGAEKAKKALFITAATVPHGFNPRPKWLDESLDYMKKLTEEFDETSLEEGEYIPDDLSQYDFIFATGGNTFYLASRYAETGLGAKIKEYVAQGGIYSGSSAGGVITMQRIDQFTPVDSPEKAPKIYPGLGLVDFAVIPHADNEKFEKQMEGIAKVFEEQGKEVFILNDDQVLAVDGDIKEIV